MLILLITTYSLSHTNFCGTDHVTGSLLER